MDVLAIAVHPDDETLGCGATLLKHAAAGDTLHWLIVTAATPERFSAEQIAKQAAQVEQVRMAYPFASLNWLKLPTTRLETLPLDDIVRPIRDVVAARRPEVVYLPNRSDAHSDHRVTFAAASAVLKSFYLRAFGVRRVLLCETISETDAAPPLAENAFQPQLFVDVSGTLRRKLDVFALYASEHHVDHHPRTRSSIEALARWRGSTIGVEYAEAFFVMREIG
jgi:LmbE family N-acetylglucosaminyl deacetylase